MWGWDEHFLGCRYGKVEALSSEPIHRSPRLVSRRAWRLVVASGTGEMWRRSGWRTWRLGYHSNGVTQLARCNSLFLMTINLTTSRRRSNQRMGESAGHGRGCRGRREKRRSVSVSRLDTVAARSRVLRPRSGGWCCWLVTTSRKTGRGPPSCKRLCGGVC